MNYREAVRRLAADAPEVPWAITASANLALRGFDVEPGDVDMMTTERGAYAFEEAFSRDVVRPVVPPTEAAGERIRSHYGALSLAGVDVEVMGDVAHRVGDEWVPAGDVAAEREFLSADGVEAPVMSLEHECEGYRALGREGRVELVERGPEPVGRR